MPKPTIGQPNWGDTLNAHLDTIEADVATRATSAVVNASLAAKQDSATLDSAVAAKLGDSGSASGALLAAKQRKASFDVRDYGAVLDGSTDDTTATQAAVEAALAAGGGTVVGFQGKVASVSTLTARSGVTIDLGGGTLKARSSTPTGVIMSPAWAGVGHIDDFTVRNGTIDQNGLTNCGAIFKDAARCTVDRVRFINIKDNSSGAVNLNLDTTDCKVTNCTIEMQIDYTAAVVLSMPGIHCTSSTVDSQGGGQNATLTFTQPTNLSQGHLIQGNRIIGGTHGVVLYGAAKCRVTGNHIESSSHRSIILSPVANDNIISGNECHEFVSTGIHLAWGCSRNVITGNALSTTRSALEGDGIKGYYGCNSNTVSGNLVKGVVGSAYRFASGSVRNQIVGNRAEGCKYGVHIQNALVAADGYYVPASLPDASANAVVGNQIDGAGSPAGNVGIRLQTQTVAMVRFTLVSANVIHNTATGIELMETGGGGAIAGTRAYGNSIESPTPWTAARGTDHFTECVGNGSGLANKLAGGKTTLPASATTAASINIPHGTAPTSPANGDMWTTTAGLFVRINGATVGPLT